MKHLRPIIALLSLSALTGGALHSDCLGNMEAQAVRVDYQAVEQYQAFAAFPIATHLSGASGAGTVAALPQIAVRTFASATQAFSFSPAHDLQSLPAYLLYGALLFYDC